MKKIMKWCRRLFLGLLIMVLTFVGLVGLAGVALYLPQVQNWAVGKATTYASELTGMQVSVGQVRLKFPLILRVDNVLLTEQKDTIAAIKTLDANVRMKPLFTGNVDIDHFDIYGVKLNTAEMVEAAVVKGEICSLQLSASSISLEENAMRLSNIMLSGADIDVMLADSIPEDTTTTEPTCWIIDADKVSVTDTKLTLANKNALQEPDLREEEYKVKCELPELRVDGLHLDLGKAIYSLQSSKLRAKQLSVFYADMIDSTIDNVGIEIDSFFMDSERMAVPSAVLMLGESILTASAEADMKAFDSIPDGRLKAMLNARICKQDLINIAGLSPKTLRPYWPTPLNSLLNIELNAEGNMQHIDLNKVAMDMPGVMKAEMKGFVDNMNDVNAIRAGVTLDGAVRTGRLKAQADIDIAHSDYTLSLDARDIPVARVTHTGPVEAFSANLNLTGHGFDYTSPRTHAKGGVQLDYLKLDNGMSVNDLACRVEVDNGNARLLFDSSDDRVEGQLSLEALYAFTPSSPLIKATFGADVRKVDFVALGLIQKPLDLSFCGHFDLETDLDKTFNIDGAIREITLHDTLGVQHPKDIELSMSATSDTTIARLATGDLTLRLNGETYLNIINSADGLSSEIDSLMKLQYIDYPRLRNQLPRLCLNLHAGSKNVVSRLMAYRGLDLGAVDVDMSSSPENGLSGHAIINDIKTVGQVIDHAELNISSTDSTVNYGIKVENSNPKRDYRFRALIDGDLHGNEGRSSTKFYDADGNLGVSLALHALMEDDGVRIAIDDLNPVMGYKVFHANRGGGLFLGFDGRVGANVRMKADDGTGILLYSDNNEETLQDLTLSLYKIDIGSICATIPYAPPLEGWFTGDLHVIQTEENLTLSTNFDIKDFGYEHSRIGDIGAELVYLPSDDSLHHVDGILTAEGMEVGTLEGAYDMDNSRLSASIQMQGFPLKYANAFIPDQVMGLRGTGAAELSLNGPVDTLDINGQVYFEKAYLYSEPYGIEMLFDEKPVAIEHNKMLFNDFALYAKDNSPLKINGNLDFTDLALITLNARMQAKNFKLIDSKQNRRSETFGKCNVDFFANATGPLEALSIRGYLNVLGSTDMTYILRDSPLTTDNQLDELVKFVNFSDTTKVVTVERPPIDGLSMDLTINVDESARILCALNESKSNYVDLVGRGNLRMKYEYGDIRLNGNYTLTNGQMKFSLPVIPLKTFTIQDGSSVDFSGDPFNPRLNITATEQMKVPVTSDDGSSRSVMFNTGVVITKTLNDMGLEFIVDAPEDMTLHNELQTMSVENRGKIAVTMLTTGMYLADGNTNSFTMNNALSSFLNSQINKISSGALRSLDMNFDMAGNVGASGQTHTDYSFKFAKRFWGNRMRVVIGGKLTSGEDENEPGDDTFFDNITLEYRLSPTSNQYINMFYKRDSYDWLEGYMSEFGLGYLWRKKFAELIEMVPFTKKRTSQTFTPKKEASKP